MPKDWSFWVKASMCTPTALLSAMLEVLRKKVIPARQEEINPPLRKFSKLLGPKSLSVDLY